MIMQDTEQIAEDHRKGCMFGQPAAFHHDSACYIACGQAGRPVDVFDLAAKNRDERFIEHREFDARRSRIQRQDRSGHDYLLTTFAHVHDTRRMGRSDYAKGLVSREGRKLPSWLRGSTTSRPRRRLVTRPVAGRDPTVDKMTVSVVFPLVP
ncbi:hypothetical protein [Sphingomonas glacialis]|uniref:hypothetical protein n=1 Tax=Sphingomonas glacialis TaxID=658225 RepID=UPI001E606397|nr:hypothetical protein [Sphingomonas glacialis]